MVEEGTMMMIMTMRERNAEALREGVAEMMTRGGKIMRERRKEGVTKMMITNARKRKRANTKRYDG